MLYGIKCSADIKPWALTRFAEVQVLLDCNTKHYVCFPSRRGHTVWHFHNVSEKTSALQWNNRVKQLYSWTCAREGRSGRTRQERNQLGMIWVSDMAWITTKWVASFLTCDGNLLVIVASENLFKKGCLNHSWGRWGSHQPQQKHSKGGNNGTPITNAWQTTSVIFMTLLQEIMFDSIINLL